MSKKILTIVTGSSNSGASCIAELFARYGGKYTVRGVFRTEEKAKPFREMYPDLEIVTGIDANNPQSLAPAFKGADSALIVTTCDRTKGFSEDARLTANLINASFENKVKYNVLVSAWTSKCDNKKIAQSRFKPTEELLVRLSEQNGTNWTILRGGIFMENLFFMLKESLKKDFISFPNLYYPKVDTRDIGKSAAVCLGSDDPAHFSKYYELSGPENLTGDYMAQVFSKVLGRQIKYNEMSMDDFRKYSSPYLTEIFDYMHENGKSAVPFTQDVKNITGEHTTLEEFVIRHKSNW